MTEELPFCVCGCGERVSKVGNRLFWTKLICYALEYDETYYNIKQINIYEEIKWKQTTEVILNMF